MSAKAALPNWPASMRQDTAARYCDLTIPQFEREVADGRLPLPFELGGRDHWTKTGLDKALAVLTGEADNDWRIGSPLYGDAA